MLYVAYGSNMCAKRTRNAATVRQMARRCPKAKPLAAIWLTGWRLVMKRVADIEPDPHALTPAALWEITRTCERALDAYEGFPHLYIKERISMALPNGRRAKPMAYVMNGPRQRDYGPASDGYLAAIADGYRDFGFEDLAPLRAAQAEAISVSRRAEHGSRCDADAFSAPWAPGVAFGCE